MAVSINKDKYQNNVFGIATWHLITITTENIKQKKKNSTINITEFDATFILNERCHKDITSFRSNGTDQYNSKSQNVCNKF